MRIEKVSYQRLYPTGLFENLKIGVEVIVNEGEDAKQALNVAKDLVTEFYIENMAEIESQRGIKLTTTLKGKKPMDIVIRQIYDNAVRNEDTETIYKITEEYNVEIN